MRDSGLYDKVFGIVRFLCQSDIRVVQRCSCSQNNSFFCLEFYLNQGTGCIENCNLFILEDGIDCEENLIVRQN